MSQGGETPLQICELADPAKGCLLADDNLTATLRLALQPWHLEGHHLFPRALRSRVVLLMLVQVRLAPTALALPARVWKWRIIPLLPRFSG